MNAMATVLHLNNIHLHSTLDTLFIMPSSVNTSSRLGFKQLTRAPCTRPQKFRRTHYRENYIENCCKCL